VSPGNFFSVVQRAYYPPLTVRVGCFSWRNCLAEGVSLGNFFSVVQRADYSPSAHHHHRHPTVHKHS
jgi:hypothetical protein